MVHEKIPSSTMATYGQKNHLLQHFTIGKFPKGMVIIKKDDLIADFQVPYSFYSRFDY